MDGLFECGQVLGCFRAVESREGDGDVRGEHPHPGFPVVPCTPGEHVPGDVEVGVGGGGQQAGQFTEPAEDVDDPLCGKEGQRVRVRRHRAPRLAVGASAQFLQKPGQERSVGIDVPDAGADRVPDPVRAANVCRRHESGQGVLLKAGVTAPVRLKFHNQRLQIEIVEDKGGAREAAQRLWTAACGRAPQTGFPCSRFRMVGDGGIGGRLLPGCLRGIAGAVAPVLQELFRQRGAGGVLLRRDQPDRVKEVP